MRKWRPFLLTIIALALVGSAPSRAAVSRKSKPSKPVTFYAISELKQLSGASPSLIGGTPADPKDWPASFYSMHGGGACTGTLVGPRALLTAAHCVAGGREATLAFQGKTYSCRCSYSKQYDPHDAKGKTADWALCLLDRAINGITYETVNDDATRVIVNRAVLLTGFGCTKPDMSGGNDGVFRTAEAPVKELPTGGNNDIKTEVATGRATLCPGDSGGGAFLTAPNLSRRVQISVNSRTQVRMTPAGSIAVGISYLSSVSTPAAKKFLADWMKGTGQEICGLTTHSMDCRQVP